MGMTVTSFSVYQPYLIDIGGLTNGQSSLLITIRSLSALVAMVLFAWFYGKVHLRLGLTISLGFTTLAFLIFGLADSMAGYAVAAAIAGLSYGFGGMIAVSALISQWFSRHRALALGICAAATGVSSVVLSPLVTIVVQRFSLATAFLTQTALCALITVVVGLVVRAKPQSLPEQTEQTMVALENAPHGVDRIDIIEAEETNQEIQAQTVNPRSPVSGRINFRNMIPVCIAMVLMGCLGNTAYAHLSVLYSTAGFSPHDVSIILSVIGFTLIVSKIVYGQSVDRLGGYASNNIFFALVFIGYILCSLADYENLAGGLIAIVIAGFGLPIATVGISVFAADLAGVGSQIRMLQVFQVLYAIGSTIFGFVPGLIADQTGSYAPFYAATVGVTLLCFVLIQLSYRHVRRQRAHAVA
jgi:MFS family permease